MHRTNTLSRPDRTAPPASLAAQPRGIREVHILTLIAAGVLILKEAPKLWFYLDEWDFLANRGVRLGTQGLFYPHNNHWVTIPILIWRGLFNLVGVRDYWLYSLPAVLAHLAVVYLLWRLMLRHKVEPWTATLLAATFAVVSVGYFDFTFAFQLAFVGSVVFGLLAIEAVEREQRWLPPIWGTCALMCSGMGIPMVAGCGLVALAHRKPKLAAWAVLPPAAIFLIWYLTIGHDGTNAAANIQSLSIGGLASYVWTGLRASMSGYFHAPQYVGAVLVIVLTGAAALRRNVPAALAIATLGLYAFVGLGRFQLGATEAEAGRYSYVAIALFLPLVGQLISILTRTRVLRPIVMSGLVLLVGVNAVALHRNQLLWGAYVAHYDKHSQIQAAAYLIHKGEKFPGQFPAWSLCSNIICVRQDVLKVSTLTAWIRQGQYPIPSTIAARSLRAERAVLGVSASSNRGYRGALTLATPGAKTCSTVGPGSFVTVHLSTSGSLRIASVPRQDIPILTVTFYGVPSAPSTSIIVPVLSRDRWLNLPSGTYTTALISTSNAVRVCEVSAQ